MNKELEQAIKDHLTTYLNHAEQEKLIDQLIKELGKYDNKVVQLLTKYGG